MDREKLKTANKLNDELFELEDFYNETSNLFISVRTSNGGEGSYLKSISESLNRKAKDLVIQLVADEIIILKKQLEEL